jgi:hypothetical protein
MWSVQRCLATDRETGLVLSAVRERFDRLKALRRGDQLASLELLGETAGICLSLLRDHASRRQIVWAGRGTKQYDVFATSGDVEVFSRAVNRTLFIEDPDDFEDAWRDLLLALESQPGALRLSGVDRALIDAGAYTAVIGFAATTDIFGTGNRGGPGVFFEMLVGPLISLLTGRPETGAVPLQLPDGTTETVPVDLSFFGQPGDPALMVPTKISTRERISQAFVHQAMLEKALAPEVVRTALCIGNENNMVNPGGGSRSLATATVKETLVPRTIVQYQRYIAELDGLYYLDPPEPYINSTVLGFPRVKRFHELVTNDDRAGHDLAELEQDELRLIVDGGRLVIKSLPNRNAQRFGEGHRNGVANLMANVISGALEHVVVGESLKPRCFSRGEWAVLRGVAVSTSREAVEAPGDCRTLPVGAEPSIHIRPASS